MTKENVAPNTRDKKVAIYSAGFHKLVKSVDVTDITLDTIVMIIIKSIEITDGYKSLSGMEKKNMVIAIVNLLVKRYVSNESIRSPIIDFVDSFGNAVIDSVISVSKNKFKINSKKMYERFKVSFYIYRLVKRLLCNKAFTKEKRKEEDMIMNDVFNVKIPVPEGALDALPETGESQSVSTTSTLAANPSATPKVSTDTPVAI